MVAPGRLVSAGLSRPATHHNSAGPQMLQNYYEIVIETSQKYTLNCNNLCDILFTERGKEGKPNEVLRHH